MGSRSRNNLLAIKAHRAPNVARGGASYVEVVDSGSGERDLRGSRHDEVFLESGEQVHQFVHPRNNALLLGQRSTDLSHKANMSDHPPKAARALL
jgi:hypothetical protein